MTSELLPKYTTPEAFAEHFGVSERTVREIARRLGACSQIGNAMILREDDVYRIMEETRPCPSKYSAVERSGTIEAPLMGGGYEDLRARLNAKSQKGSKRKSKRGRGNDTSMVPEPD
ncbi:hypothetical protein [Roseibium sp.]|uniref:hypothetical protein n=1 Tax=Roseibium sp. TaxID=1936156 RepID=UPI0039EFB952